MRADIANRGGREQRQIVRNDDFTGLSHQGRREESSIQKSKIEPNRLKMAKTVDAQPHQGSKTRYFDMKICLPYQQISADCSLS